MPNSQQPGKETFNTKLTIHCQSDPFHYQLFSLEICQHSHNRYLLRTGRCVSVSTPFSGFTFNPQDDFVLKLQSCAWRLWLKKWTSSLRNRSWQNPNHYTLTDTACNSVQTNAYTIRNNNITRKKMKRKWMKYNL